MSDTDDADDKGRPRKAPTAFRTISEVADDLNIPQHVLRFWESKFPQLKPLKRGGGRRYYRPEDIALLKRKTTPHRVRLLPERPKEATDNFGLAVEIHQAFFELPGELHPVVQLTLLLARQRVTGTRRRDRFETVYRIAHQ
jgi:hypothetical protein